MEAKLYNINITCIISIVKPQVYLPFGFGRAPLVLKMIEYQLLVTIKVSRPLLDIDRHSCTVRAALSALCGPGAART